MFDLSLISFRSRTLDIIQQEFAFNPAIPGNHATAFDQATKAVKMQGGNEYEAAIAFMLSHIKTLDANDPTLDSLTKNVHANAERIAAEGKIGAIRRKAHY